MNSIEKYSILHENQKIIAIMGPTAAGKTAFAAALARALDGEIVSVDSAQVYRGMDIGTAKADAALQQEIPHHLIDIRDPAEPYSAADFARDAREAVAEIHGRGRVPILAGGTMLYFRALLDGLSPLPPADPAVRARLDNLEAEAGVEALHGRLGEVDPEAAARLHPNDPQRIKRALEVHEITGKTISELQRVGEPGPDWAVLRMVIAPADRAFLHRRIARRFEKMLADGFLDEVRGLYGRSDLDESLPSVRSVGYRQAWQHLAGRIDHDEMVARGIAATRQLAKRQLTWLRRELEADRFAGPDPEGVRNARARAARFLAAKP